MSFDDTKTVVTPEQVSVTYTLAGIGTRFGAILLDTCIQGIAVVLIFFVGTALGMNLDIQGVAWLETASALVIAITVLVVVAIGWGYFVLFETYWNGQTPGKRAAGIRVMRDGGYPIDFRAAFIRNVVRVVDFLPLYGVGALAMFLSKESKRLGDYAAGTIVVVDSRDAPKQPVVEPPPVVGQPSEYTVLGDPALLNLRALTREQFAVVDRFLSRRTELSQNVRGEMGRKIALPLMPLIGFQMPAADWFPYETFLVELAAAYRRLNAG